MAKSIAFAADASRLAALLLSCIPARMSPSSRLASQAPRPRSSTDLAIRGPLVEIPCTRLDARDQRRSADWRARTALLRRPARERGALVVEVTDDAVWFFRFTNIVEKAAV